MVYVILGCSRKSRSCQLVVLSRERPGGDVGSATNRLCIARLTLPCRVAGVTPSASTCCVQVRLLLLAGLLHPIPSMTEFAPDCIYYLLTFAPLSPYGMAEGVARCSLK